MNKNEATIQLNKLQKEVDKLKQIIESKLDLFSITTYSEVCAALCIIEKKQSDFDTLKEYRYHQMLNIQKLYNGNNKSNYYYPYFRRTGSGLVFFYSSYYSVSFFYGQVAYFKDSKTSDYIGKVFTFIYEDLV